MKRIDPTELQTDQGYASPVQTISEEALASCRNHLESLQNLRYLVLLEADQPQQIKLHLRMMEWHLDNLGQTLFEHHM